jgi:hypothetical protein
VTIALQKTLKERLEWKPITKGESQMSWDGFYPDVTCTRCGKIMGDKVGDSYNRPAEVYAGTYTGLCNVCMNEADYTVKEYGCGAKLISTKPNLPSYRRDRQEHIAYTDCLVCSGKGWIMERGQHGSYKGYCKACMTRFYNYPQRVFRAKYIEAERHNILKLLSDRFNAEIKPLTVRLNDRGMLTGYNAELENNPQFVALRDKCRAMYDEKMNKLRNFVNIYYPEP